jgi:hypothetical protein
VNHLRRGERTSPSGQRRLDRGQHRGVSPHRLEENLGAASVELTPDDLRDIESAAARITVHGARYPERLERMTGLLRAGCHGRRAVRHTG